MKALCLGAKGVGIGRPTMYSLAWGEEGVIHAIESESARSACLSLLQHPSRPR